MLNKTSKMSAYPYTAVEVLKLLILNFK